MESDVTLVLGSNGLVGSAIQRAAKFSYRDFYFATRHDADLTVWEDVQELFDRVRPVNCIMTSAKVGGIGGNLAMPHDFFIDNIRMNSNVIEACIEQKVQRLLAFSSVCVFPDDLAMLEEDRMHDGPVFSANASYGYSKRMVDVQIQAAKQQHGVSNWCSVIPGNIFGPCDMFSVEHGHIIPALIHKFFNAMQDDSAVQVWGDGQSLREFIYVDDLATSLMRLLHTPSVPDRLIVSGPKEYSIAQIVEWLKEISGHDEVYWDRSKPNGQRSRPSSKERFDRYIPNFSYTNIRRGLEDTWDWFVDNYPNVRKSY